MAKRSAAPDTANEAALSEAQTPSQEPVLPLPTEGGHFTRNEAGELVPYTPPQE